MSPAAIFTGEIIAADRTLERVGRSLDALGDAAGSGPLRRLRGRLENQLEGSRDQRRGLRQRIGKPDGASGSF